MLQDGLYKVIAGFTSFEEVLKLIEVDDEINAAHTMGRDEDSKNDNGNNSNHNHNNDDGYRDVI